MKKMNVMILTADDSKKVFRMDQERLEAALSRHPQVRELADFEICRTSTSYENDPGVDFCIEYKKGNLRGLTSP